ncbi:MAG: cobalamin-dependent protein, partial [Bacteroidota bacterium]
MKILFTHGYFLEEDAKEQEIMRPYPPLGLLYISAYLEQHGFPNEVFDSTFQSFEKLKQHLLRTRPNMIGIYTNLMTKLNVLKIIRLIKNEPTLSDLKIILGGPEVRNHKEKFLQYGADVIVFGEGEDTMLELAKAFSASSNPDLSDLQGVAFKYNGEVIEMPDRILIRDINQLPFPARKKIDLQLYFDTWKNKHGISMVNVSTMRGCPY